MEWLDALLIAVAGLLATAHIVQQIGSWKSVKLRLPPGPPGWPVVGNLLLFGAPHPPMELAKLAKQYGPLMSLRMGSNLAVVVSSPEMAKEILKVKDENFASRPRAGAVDSLIFPEGSVGFVSLGPGQQARRKFMITELITPKRLQQHERMRRQELSACVKSVLDETSTGASGGNGNWKRAEVDVHVKCTSVTTNIMSQLIMSKRFCTFEADGEGRKSEMAGEAAEFMSTVHEANMVLGIKMFGDHIPSLAFLDTILYKQRIARCRARLSKFFDRAIAEHRQHMYRRQPGQDRPSDFIDAILALPDQPGIQIDNVIKGMIGDILFAGIDTPAVTAEWAMAELLREPLCMHKAQAELDAVVGKDRLTVQESDLPSLPYIQAIMKETLRLHPVAPFLIPHCSVNDSNVAGFDIPANTTVFVNVWAVQRSDAYHNPDDFNPHRFLDRAADLKGATNNLDWIPFGAGRRMCPAANLGLGIATCIVASLLHSFDWSLPDAQKAEDLDMSSQFGLSFPKRLHLIAVPSPRLPLDLYSSSLL